MGILNFINKALTDVNNDLDAASQEKRAEELKRKMEEADNMGLSDEEKQHIKDDDYEATDFEEEPDNNEVNDDDYYSEDN